MKLFTKISLIVAAIALGLGIVGVGIGLAMGANMSQLSEMGIYISPNHVEVRHHGGETKDYAYNLKDINRLDIEVRNAEITIFATEDTEQIRYYSNSGKDISRVEKGTLKLEDRNSGNKTLELEIYIPVGLLKEIDIEAMAGTVTADKLIADSVTIEVDAASVQIEELIVTKEADLQAEAGKIMIGYYDGPRLDVNCAVGSIMVVCEGNEFDYNYEMECGMGRIVFGEESYSLVGEKVRRNHEGNKMIDAECELGEIIIEFPNSL